MTGILQEVLREHAASAPDPAVDLDRVVGEGNNRVRRTQRAIGLAAAAIAVVIAGGVFTLPRLLSEPDDGGHVAHGASPFAEHRIGYAFGDVIHWGRESFSVGAPVMTYVQTEDGFVYTTKDRSVWLYDGAHSRRIGRSLTGALRADDTGSLVTWVGRAADGHPQYVVYDTHSRAVKARVDGNVARAAVGPDDGGAFVYAVDDGSVYWRTAEGLVRYDVSSGESVLVSKAADLSDLTNRAGLPRMLDDVANGRIAYQVSSTDGHRMMVGRSIGQDAKEMGPGAQGNLSQGNLSPDGRYLAVLDNSRLRVFDTATGVDTMARTEADHGLRFVFGWVDDHTAMVIAFKHPAAKPQIADFLLCDVPDGGCSRVLRADVTNQVHGFALPNGDGW